MNKATVQGPQRDSTGGASDFTIYELTKGKSCSFVRGRPWMRPWTLLGVSRSHLTTQAATEGVSTSPTAPSGMCKCSALRINSGTRRVAFPVPSSLRRPGARAGGGRDVGGEPGGAGGERVGNRLGHGWGQVAAGRPVLEM